MALDKTNNVRVTADLPASLFERLHKFVQAAGESKQRFIRAAIREKMRRDSRRHGIRAIQ